MIGKLAVTKIVHAIPTAPTDVLAMVSNGNVVNQKWTDTAQKEDSNQTENVLKETSKLFQNVSTTAKKSHSTVSVLVKKVTMDSTVEKNVETRNENVNKPVHVTNNVPRAVHALDGVTISVHVHATSSTPKKLHAAKVNVTPYLPIAKLLAVVTMNKSAKVNVSMIMLIVLLVVHAIKTVNMVALVTITILLTTLIAVETFIPNHQKMIIAESYGAMKWMLVELIVQLKHINASRIAMEMKLVKPPAVKTTPSALAVVHVTKNVQMAVHVQFGMICQTSAQVICRIFTWF